MHAGDYWGYDFFSVDSNFNDDKSPVRQDPTVDIGMNTST